MKEMTKGAVFTCKNTPGDMITADERITVTYFNSATLKITLPS